MKKFFLTFIGFTFLLILSSCSSNSTDPEEINDYMSLSVGDIREYYDAGIDLYQIWEIKRKIKRSDSVDVFIGEWTSSFDSVSYNDYSYYAIQNGYFIATNLEKTANLENPFGEQKLAKINPKDGDRWVQTEGVVDSEKVYFSAKYIGDYETSAAMFEDVFGFTLSDILTIYYSKYYGHIGSSTPVGETFKISINYAKINGKEIGHFVPLTKQNQLSKKNNNIKIRKVNILGQHIE